MPGTRFFVGEGFLPHAASQTASRTHARSLRGRICSINLRRLPPTILWMPFFTPPPSEIILWLEFAIHLGIPFYKKKSVPQEARSRSRFGQPSKSYATCAGFSLRHASSGGSTRLTERQTMPFCLGIARSRRTGRMPAL